MKLGNAAGLFAIAFASLSAHAGSCKGNWEGTAVDDYAGKTSATTLDECLSLSKVYPDFEYAFKVKMDGSNVAIHFIKAGFIKTTVGVQASNR